MEKGPFSTFQDFSRPQKASVLRKGKRFAPSSRARAPPHARALEVSISCCHRRTGAGSLDLVLAQTHERVKSSKGGRARTPAHGHVRIFKNKNRRQCLETATSLTRIQIQMVGVWGDSGRDRDVVGDLHATVDRARDGREGPRILGGLDGAQARLRETKGTPTAAERTARENYATLGDARAHILALMRQQVDAADAEGTLAGATVRGDGTAHMLLSALLPSHMQRLVFLDLVGDRRAWPRVRSLFGAPPYAFLGPGDAGILRAAGVAAGRKNLTYNGFHVINYAQFGSAHLVDEHARQFRLSQDHQDDASPVSVLALHGAGAPVRATVVVRIRKRARVARAEMLRSAEGRRALSFPMIGERLSLTPTESIARLLAISGSDEALPISVRVTSVRVATPGASTALVDAALD